MITNGIRNALSFKRVRWRRRLICGLAALIDIYNKCAWQAGNESPACHANESFIVVEVTLIEPCFYRLDL
jgi:hypothetical protein